MNLLYLSCYYIYYDINAIKLIYPKLRVGIRLLVK